MNDPARSDQLFDNSDLDAFLEDNEGDVYLSAADGWRVKAARVSEWYNTGLDGSFLNRSQAFDHAMKMVTHYQEEGRGALKSILLDTDYGEPREEESEMA